ncbi:MAG: cell division protein FtsA, partial [Maribacter sp.]|nr:cell division protein FtsA [Maribacter sp.]
GYPNEHLAGDTDEAVASPLYATAVGLLMNAVKNHGKEIGMNKDEEQLEEMAYAEHDKGNMTSDNQRSERKTVFDKWSEKLKDFLDNAE